MSIRFTLIGLLGILTAVVGVANYISIDNLRSINDNVVNFSDNSLRSVKLLGEINAAASRFRYLEAEHIFTRNAQEASKKELDLDDIELTLHSHAVSYEQCDKTPDETERFKAFSAKWQDYMQLHAKILQLSHERRDAEAAVIYEGPMGRLFDQLTTILRGALSSSGSSP